MVNLILFLILAAVLIPVVRYLVKAKKSGQRCVGCPSGGSCCTGGKECHCHENP